jgi:hypothetical protein
MKRESVFVVDIIGEVVDKVSTILNMPINYVYGDAVDILRNLKDKDNSVTLKDSKYVLFALYMPFVERRGVSSLHYADVTIRRMTIAALTNSDDEPMTRYAKTFRPILYPVYESFLTYFARNEFIASKEPNTIVHTKTDIMGAAPISGINDFVDCINLDNFNFTVNQILNC